MELLVAIALTIFTLLSKPNLLPKFAPVYQPPSPSPTLLPNTPPTTTPPSIVKYQISPQPSEPWGVAIKVADHSYRIQIANDPRMGTSEEILEALNQYRVRNGVQPLTSDPRLCKFAQSRAEYFNQIKAIDAHKGFVDYLDNQDGFNILGYRQLGENSSYGYVMSGVHLIEFIYRASAEHDKNQLQSKWDHACAGISGSASDLIFATSPL